MKIIVEQKICEAMETLQGSGELAPVTVPEILIARPEAKFGEYTSNIALVLGKQVKKPPMEIAQAIVSRIKNPSVASAVVGKQASGEEQKLFSKIEVVKPGYINFFLSQPALVSVLPKILREKQEYGNSTLGQDIRVNNEFISANPTGPLHLGNGRGGFYADSVTRILRKVGFGVTNEYYVNDAGEQIVQLGHSVLQDEKAVYTGEYIEDMRQQLAINNKQESFDAEEIGEKAAEYIMEHMIKKTLSEKMNITFDVFTSEKKDIIQAGWVDKALTILKEKGKTFEQDGAVWLRTTEYHDDKDRVLIKSDGAKTYFASDCGYILQKMERGFDRLIETWGADHHSYQFRFRAAAQALGFGEGKRIDFRLVQLVKLVKDGQEVKMSKRAGNIVTLDELIDLVGYDIVRFFFLMYAPDTHMNFDMGLAEERSQKNPVFYVQYAHARLASIVRKADEEGYTQEGGDVSLLTHEKERALLREIYYFPEFVAELSLTLRVHQLSQYAITLADKLHSFYGACRVIDAGNKPLTLARLELIRAVKIVLKETLDLMGISAPEKM